jgi:hypothetical protein
MTVMQTRRHFLVGLSIAAAPGALRTRYARAAEGDLETRSVRIFANRPGICVAPQYIAERYCAPRVSPMSASWV